MSSGEDWVFLSLQRTFFAINLCADFDEVIKKGVQIGSLIRSRHATNSSLHSKAEPVFSFLKIFMHSLYVSKQALNYVPTLVL